MTPMGPLSTRRFPDPLRLHMEIAAAAAWESLVEVHASHALRFIVLMATHQELEETVERFLEAMDVRDPMASAVRSRVLVALERALKDSPGRPSLHTSREGAATTEEGDEAGGLKRFRPDVLMRGLVRKVREGDAHQEWVRLATARAEEAVIRTHVDNAVAFATLLRGQESFDDAVDLYLETLEVGGGRGQSVHQRTMARLAELHLPVDAPAESNPKRPPAG